MSGGWYPDPTGRFPARYHDGTDWSDQVQGADGQVSTDAMERRSSGFAAPSAPTPAPAPAWGAAPAPAWGGAPAAAGAPWGAAAPSADLDRSSGTLGLVVAGFGWLLAAVSFFALDWAESVTRGDITDNLPDSLPDGAPFADLLSFNYLQWAGIALVVLVALGLGLVAVTLRGDDSTAPRLLVGALAAVAAVLQAVTVVRLLGDNAEIGAQLGIFAYLLVIVGLAIGSKARTAPSA